MAGWIEDAEQLEEAARIVETEAPSVFHLTNASAAQASTLRCLAAELRRRAAIGEPYPFSDREWRGDTASRGELIAPPGDHQLTGEGGQLTFRTGACLSMT